MEIATHRYPASTPVGWAYMTRGKTNGVRVHLLDGESVTLYANAQDSATLLRLVSSRAPHAIIGYGAQQSAYASLVKAARAAKTPPA